jgi:uncharacterized protein (DUF952 family)
VTERYIYHIIDGDSTSNLFLKGFYSPATLSLDGFIHCSFFPQLEQVLYRFFSTATKVTILKIDITRLFSELIVENLEGGAELFPHIYGPINLECIVTTIQLTRNLHAQFDLSGLIYP